MIDDPLELAVMGVTEELEEYEPAGDVGSYDDGYKQALEDTIANLRVLQRSLTR